MTDDSLDDGADWWHQLDLDNRYRQEIEMDARQFIGSAYLKQSDIERPVLQVIRRVSVENVAQDDKPEEKKIVLHFDGLEKGMVVNITNGDAMFALTGSWDTDAWIGRKIVIFVDPEVLFGGKKVGGLRLRAPKTSAPPPPVREEALDDDVNF